MIEVGKAYNFDYRWSRRAGFVFVVVAEEPYWPPRPPSNYVPGQGFRILILDGEIPDPLKGPTKAGEHVVVAASSAVACDAKPF